MRYSREIDAYHCRDLSRLFTPLQIERTIHELWGRYVRRVVVEDFDKPGRVDVYVLLRWWTLLIWPFGVRRQLQAKVERLIEMDRPAGIIVDVHVRWRWRIR